ncbi:MAG: ABC transporter permease, partial [Paracoccaceae bacterium]|nr:ABC transporter permease [Paracoccaceae bacterium]
KLNAEKLVPLRTPAWYRQVNKMFVVGFIILTPLLLMAILAQFLNFLDPTTINPSQKLLPPSWVYPLGTDHFGRDVLARTVYGSQISLRVGLGATLLTAVFGIFLGAASGWNNWADAIIGRISDSLMIFPGFVLAIMIMAAIGPSEFNVILSVTVLYVPRVIRTVRASVIEFRDAEFVEAARTVGAGELRLLFLHILPKAVGPVMVQLSFCFAWAILVEAGLSFLGLGTPPPAPSWGSMIAEARDFIRSAWWLITVPGCMITLAVLGLNMIGDGLRDMLDPRIRSRVDQ